MSHPSEHTPEHHEHVDQWHLHTLAEGTPQAEHGSRANPWVLLAVFVCSVVFLIVFIGATVIYAKGYLSRVRAAKVEVTTWSGDARAAKAIAQHELASYGWVEPGAGRVRVPVDVVMKQMANQATGAPAPSRP